MSVGAGAPRRTRRIASCAGSWCVVAQHLARGHAGLADWFTWLACGGVCSCGRWRTRARTQATTHEELERVSTLHAVSKVADRPR
jgi:hypothetical protein